MWNQSRRVMQIGAVALCGSSRQRTVLECSGAEVEPQRLQAATTVSSADATHRAVERCYERMSAEATPCFVVCLIAPC